MYLTIESPQLNLATQQEGAFGLQLGEPEGLSRQIVVQPVLTTTTVIPTTNSILSIPATGNKVASVVINGTVYQLSDSVDTTQLAPNEFVYNPYAQEIVVAQYSEAKAVEVTSPTDSVAVTISNYSEVSQVYIGGESYVVASPSTPVSELVQGQAVYDSGTGQLTFIPSSTLSSSVAIAPQLPSIQVSGTQVTPSPNPISVSIVAASNNDGYDTDFVDELPTVLQWLPLLGQISYNLNFEQSQSGQMSFETWFSYKNLVLKHLCRGAKFEAFGIGWRVENLQIVEKMRSEYPHPKLVVTVSLTDPHWWLDVEVPLVNKPLDNTGDNLDPECRTNQPSQSESNLAEYRTLSWLCSKAGGSLSGMNGKIPVPNDVSPEEGRIPRSEIQARLRQNGRFLELTDPNTVFCKSWALTQEWILQESDVLSEVSVSCQTGKQRNLEASSVFQQEIVCGLPDEIIEPAPITLRDEDTSNIYGSYYIWPKQEVTGLFLEKEQEQVEENQSDRPPLLPEYRNRQRKYEFRVDDPDQAATPPTSVESNDLSIAFWKAGQNFIKTRREITTVDGFELFVKEQKYGFIGPLAKDVYQFVNGIWTLQKVGINAFWGLIEETVSEHSYSPGGSLYEGLYLGYVKTGWRLHVFKVEPDINVGDLQAYPEDQYPTLQIQQNYYDLGDNIGEADTEGYLLALKAYTPQIIPLFEEQKYYHEPLSDYYKDAPTQGIEEAKICLPDGTSRRIAAIDKTFQQPYIVTAESKYTAALAWLDDPRNPIIRRYNQLPGTTEPKAEFPSLSTGTDSFEYRRVKINRSINTPGVRHSDDSEQDTYTVYSRSSSTGGNGGGFISQISETRIEDFDGRPDSSRRLPPVWERVEDENPAEVEEEQNRPDPKRYRYKVWTPSAPDKTPFDQLISGSQNYPLAETLAEVRTAIQTMIDIENARNSYTENLTTFFNSSMRPGDKLVYFINGERRVRRILQINPSVVFQGNLSDKPFATGTMQLTLGYVPDISFILDREVVPISATEENKRGSGVPLEVWLDPLFGDQGFVTENIPSRLYPPSAYF